MCSLLDRQEIVYRTGKIFVAWPGSNHFLQVSWRCMFDKAQRFGGIAAMDKYPGCWLLLAIRSLLLNWTSSEIFSPLCTDLLRASLACIIFSMPETRTDLGKNCPSVKTGVNCTYPTAPASEVPPTWTNLTSHPTAPASEIPHT